VLTVGTNGVSVDSWSERTVAGAHAPGRDLPPAIRRPVLNAAGSTLMLWRAKWLMLLVFLPILLAGVAIALLTPTKYPASTRLLVKMGQEYVFDPILGEAGRGVATQSDEMLQAEAELAASPVIAERVIQTLGVATLYPAIARGRNVDEGVAERRAIEAFAKDFSASASPRSSILRLTYRHEDPAIAAQTLNVAVDTYMAYRQEVLGGGSAGALSVQREEIETQLAAANDAVRSFLAENRIADFEAETQATLKLIGDINDQMAASTASRREAEGRAGGLQKQMASTPREIDLYVDPGADAQVATLRLQREELLTRYRPDSRAVQDLDQKIAQLESFVRNNPPAGSKRIGPNPTWQSLEGDQATARAEAEALASRGAELQRQLTDAETRRARLATLEPAYGKLVRERDVLTTAAGRFAERELSERARQQLAARSAGAISIYEPARTPIRSQSPRRLIVIAAAALGLITALAIGLLRVWTTRTFPTAASVEATLGLPVLASVRNR
jgi:uncharacterized protein involved in exopolysaccharide biosynthesis